MKILSLDLGKYKTQVGERGGSDQIEMTKSLSKA